MKVFIDWDVLLDVGLQRQPHFEGSARLLDSAERHQGRSALAWHTVANLEYLIRGGAREFVASLTEFMLIPETGTRSLEFALSLEMSNFEDAMPVAAAEQFGAQGVATRNLKNYKHSPIRAIAPVELLKLLA